MPNTDDNNMVLRTVFFPPELDNQLRDFAFSKHVSKGDLIRQLVIKGLEVEVLNGLKTVSQRLSSSTTPVRVVQGAGSRVPAKTALKKVAKRTAATKAVKKTANKSPRKKVAK